MSWAKFRSGFPLDQDIPKYNIQAGAITLFMMMVCTGQDWQDPYIPWVYIRRLPGGTRHNLAKLCEANWLIEVDKGQRYFIRSLEKYSDKEDRPGKKKTKWPPIPPSDPAPPRVVSPRVSEARKEAGRKGGQAKAAKRRHRTIDGSQAQGTLVAIQSSPDDVTNFNPDDVTNFDASFATDLANDVAKPLAKQGDFASKNGAFSSKNGRENGAKSAATHAGASDSEFRIPIKKESSNVDVLLIESLSTSNAREGERKTSTLEDFEQSSSGETEDIPPGWQADPRDSDPGPEMFWSPERFTEIVSERPQVKFWPREKLAAISQIEQITGDTHSFDDWALLYDKAHDNHRPDIWQLGVVTARGALKQAKPPDNMGGFTNKFIRKALAKAQIFVPSKAEQAEITPEMRDALRSQFSDGTESQPPDARDGP